MHVDTDADVLRLREGLRDLVALSAIPAVWIGSEPPAVAAGLADALVGLLQLDFAFVRLSDPGGAGAVEATRGTAWTGFQEWLEGRLTTSAPFPRAEVVPDIGDDSAPRSGLAVPVGVNGDGGVVAAASERRDFPTQMDRLLLSLAANHAAAAFKGARLVHERKLAEEALRRARDELEGRVADRTAELHVANDELSALRRVATLVAEGVRPQELFAVVAEEVGRIVDVPLVSVVRYEPDRSATECASFSTEGPLFPVGKRWSLEGTNVLQLVRDTAEPGRINDHSQLEGEIADAVRHSGIRSTVGVPVIVAGRVWGAIVVSTTRDDPLALGTEARLAEFTELVAIAVENADSHDQLTTSRARLLTAGDEARRRVVRDLHDGAQQRLVHTIVTLRLAQRALQQSDGEAESLIGEALEHAKQGNLELRELAHGILPAVLNRGGLRAGVETLVAPLTLPVRIEVPAERFPPEIEANAYFILAEALTNVVKHSGARRAEVRASVDDQVLNLEVRDDGAGDADPGGHGLVGLRDRATALGGRLKIDSPAGGGTVVAVTLPLSAN